MTDDAFAAAMESVSRLTSAEWAPVYAKLDSRGRARCIFHDDHHPSMTFRGRRYRCWSCGAFGDVVDYVRQLYGLDAVGALRRIDDDFHLGLDLDGGGDDHAAQERRRIAEAHRRFEAWREGLIVELCEVHRTAHTALMERRELTDAEVVAVKHADRAEYYAERLSYGTAEEQMQIFRDRGEIKKWIDQILSSTSERSRTA